MKVYECDNDKCKKLMRFSPAWILHYTYDDIHLIKYNEQYEEHKKHIEDPFYRQYCSYSCAEPAVKELLKMNRSRENLKKIEEVKAALDKSSCPTSIV